MTIKHAEILHWKQWTIDKKMQRSSLSNSQQHVRPCTYLRSELRLEINLNSTDQHTTTTIKNNLQTPTQIAWLSLFIISKHLQKQDRLVAENCEK